MEEVGRAASASYTSSGITSPNLVCNTTTFLPIGLPANCPAFSFTLGLLGYAQLGEFVA
jgi:hypothetical protein